MAANKVSPKNSKNVSSRVNGENSNSSWVSNSKASRKDSKVNRASNNKANRASSSQESNKANREVRKVKLKDSKIAISRGNRENNKVSGENNKVNRVRSKANRANWVSADNLVSNSRDNRHQVVVSQLRKMMPSGWRN